MWLGGVSAVLGTAYAHHDSLSDPRRLGVFLFLPMVAFFGFLGATAGAGAGWLAGVAAGLGRRAAARGEWGILFAGGAAWGVMAYLVRGYLLGPQLRDILICWPMLFVCAALGMAAWAGVSDLIAAFRWK